MNLNPDKCITLPQYFIYDRPLKVVDECTYLGGVLDWTTGLNFNLFYCTVLSNALADICCYDKYVYSVHCERYKSKVTL